MMNFLFLSPHFPPHVHLFCVRLREEGANVFGLGDQPYESLRSELRWALSDYSHVGDMHDYDQLLRSCGKFTHRHGKLDRVDSHNEHWLETEGRLRTDFNMEGFKAGAIADIKRRSRMKEKFRKAGIDVPRGRLVRTRTEAQRLAGEVGYPLVAKPDAGVGAVSTSRIEDREALERFLDANPPDEFILEEFIDGKIFSFDGLADREGNLAFHTAHAYSTGVREAVHEDADVSYYSLRDIPPDLEAAGRAVLREYGLRERFFHLVFFRTRRDGRLVALEANMRPPGGLTTDMFNYANDCDIYRAWAGVVVRNRAVPPCTRPYHCAYIGRKRTKAYARSHEEAAAALGGLLVHSEEIDPAFRAAYGDRGYLVRSPALSDIEEAIRIVQAPA